MAKADHFVHPMAFLGTYGSSTWTGYVFKETLGYTSGRHTGVDYNHGTDDEGDPAKSMGNGTIVYAKDRSDIGFGKTLIIKHELSDRLVGHFGVKFLYTRYMHLKSFAKTSGVVTAGQKIGVVGRTGTKFAHLHVDMWKGNLGVHENYHKDTRLESYLDPYRIAEKFNKPAEVRMTDKQAHDIGVQVYRTVYHREPESSKAAIAMGRRFEINGKITPDQTKKALASNRGAEWKAIDNKINQYPELKEDSANLVDALLARDEAEAKLDKEQVTSGALRAEKKALNNEVAELKADIEVMKAQAGEDSIMLNKLGEVARYFLFKRGWGTKE